MVLSGRVLQLGLAFTELEELLPILILVLLQILARILLSDALASSDLPVEASFSSLVVHLPEARAPLNEIQVYSDSRAGSN